MMPYCSYKKCKHVADKSLGEIVWPGSKDGFGREWKQVTYVCDKHFKKILKMLNIPITKEGGDE